MVKRATGALVDDLLPDGVKEAAVTTLRKKSSAATELALINTGLKLASTYLPSRAKPIIRAVETIAPYAVKNIPAIVDFMQDSRKVFRKSTMLGALKNMVHKLRGKIKD